MNFVVISPFEVRHKYKYAKNKENMIGVLADLTVSTKEEVREFLGVKKKERKKPVKMDQIEVRRLYNQGLGDGDIAKKLGISRTSIVNWRQNNSLPRNGEEEWKCGRITDNRMELYEMGLNDKEIAEEVGVGKDSVYKWRKRNGLPPNATRGGSKGWKMISEEDSI